MDPITGAIIATAVGASANGASSGLTSMLNYNFQKKLDKKAYRRQMALLQMQQAFAERMASTAHQREVADLRAAGLNPILSATGGNGAASPVVTAPSVSTGSKVDMSIDAYITDAIKAGAEIGNVMSSAKKSSADAALASAEKEKVEAQTAGIKMDNEMTKAKLDLTKNTRQILSDSNEPGYWSDVYRGIKRWYNEGFDYPNSAQKISKKFEFAKPGEWIKSPPLRYGPAKMHDTIDKEIDNFLKIQRKKEYYKK